MTTYMTLTAIGKQVVDENGIVVADTKYPEHAQEIARAMKARAEHAALLAQKSALDETCEALADKIARLKTERNHWASKVERLADELAALRVFVTDLEWLGGHGCVSGDCPHQDNFECADCLRGEMTRIAKEAKSLREVQ